VSANTNIQLTLQAWSDIVEERWLDKIHKLGIGQTGMLENSFRHQVITDGAGNPERIEFAFNFYGRFVDIGVGRGMQAGVTKDDPGYWDYRDFYGQLNIYKRKSKKWYSNTLYAERQKLVRILADKYSHIGTITVVETLTKTI